MHRCHVIVTRTCWLATVSYVHKQQCPMSTRLNLIAIAIAPLQTSHITPQQAGGVFSATNPRLAVAHHLLVNAASREGIITAIRRGYPEVGAISCTLHAAALQTRAWSCRHCYCTAATQLCLSAVRSIGSVSHEYVQQHGPCYFVHSSISVHAWYQILTSAPSMFYLPGPSDHQRRLQCLRGHQRQH